MSFDQIRFFWYTDTLVGGTASIMNGNPKSRFEAKGLSREDLSNAPISLLRIVILADDAAGTESLPPQAVQCIKTQSAYEAAAEILAEPTAALLLDLRRVGHRHLRLLQVARDCGVEIFAVGTIPSGLSSEDLSGVRLTARSDVPQQLSRLTVPHESTPTKLEKDLESPSEKFSEPGDLEFSNPSPIEIPPEMEQGRYISEEIGEADLEAM
jgi:hypothetical protein